MVMARVFTSLGWGTSSSPGVDISASSPLAPHLQYHGLSTGLSTMLAAIDTAPHTSSMMDGLNPLSAIVSHLAY
jgi:hypothetical protein